VKTRCDPRQGARSTRIVTKGDDSGKGGGSAGTKTAGNQKFKGQRPGGPSRATGELAMQALLLGTPKGGERKLRKVRTKIKKSQNSGDFWDADQKGKENGAEPNFGGKKGDRIKGDNE